MLIFLLQDLRPGGFDLGTRAKPERRPSTPSQSTSQRPHFSNSRSLQFESTKANDLAWILDDLCQKKKTHPIMGARYTSWWFQYGNLPQIGVKIKSIWNHHLVYNYPPNQVFFWEFSLPESFFPPGQGGDFLRQIATHHGPQTKGIVTNVPQKSAKNIEQRKQNPHMMKGPWNPQLVHWFIRILLSWLLKSSLYNLYKRQGSIIPCVQQMSRLQLSNEWARCAVPKASLT